MGIRAQVASNVRRYRMALGITQAELAARLGIDRAYVSALERGLYNPTLERLEQIADALEIAPADLLQTIASTKINR